MTNFCNPTRYTYFVEIKIPQSFEDWVAVRNIRQGSCQPQEKNKQIKVGVQHFIPIQV